MLKKLLIGSLLVFLMGCTNSDKRKEIVLNDYRDLPEFSAYIENGIFCSMEQEEDPVILVHNSACSMPIQEVFGVGKAWGKCYSVDQTKLRSFEYAQFLPDSDSNLFHVFIDAGEIVYNPVNRERLTTYINEAKQVIEIPIEFSLNSHADPMLQELKLVLFEERIDEYQKREYKFYKLDDLGFYLVIMDSTKTENNYSETIKFFTFFQTDEFYADSFCSQVVGF